MQFSAAPASGFESRPNPREPSAMVQVASNTESGQPLGFKISGTGTLSEARDDSEGSAPADDSGTAAAGRDSRPEEDWARPSTLPIPWKNIAGTSSGALP